MIMERSQRESKQAVQLYGNIEDLLVACQVFFDVGAWGSRATRFHFEQLVIDKRLITLPEDEEGTPEHGPAAAR
jgi:hypothetical protein